MGCDIRDWTAIREGGQLFVRGDGTCTEGGYELRLDLTNEGIVDEPDLVALRLRIDAPEAGPDVITPVSVEWSTNDPGGGIRRVRVDTDDGSHMISVTHGVVGSVTGTSLESFSDAASTAFRDIEGDPEREGAAAADVVRLWMTKGGVVGRTQYHVEIAPTDHS
jgi:hypothetical protein